VTRWPILQGVSVQVVSVVSISGPLASGIAPTMMATALETYAETIDVMESESLHLAEETAARFREAGVPATAKIRRGETAAELIAEAREFEADLVIVGSRGIGGLARLLLGSVARRVLLHAPCSVLVVR
jgi:nucleotide-binding universal stress UspA family protein